LEQLARHLFTIFARLGGFGMLGLGILDSSFLFMPLGNDLLMVAMSAGHHAKVPYYVAMNTIGSVLGCLLIDVIFRKGGEEKLIRHVPPKRMEYIKRKVGKGAGVAIVIACLMPPPFPFTPFVMAAAALQYSRKKLLGLIAAFRMLRFSTEGLLAVLFGTRIIHLAQSKVVQGSIVVLLVICVAGSVWSMMVWIKRSRKAAGTRTV
jgi:membrane protein YqaA with SNARE-associated domain